MVRFPDNPNTEDLSGLVLFGCISGGISALFCAKFHTHKLSYSYYRNLNYLKKSTYLWHITVATAVSNINNQQLIKKLGLVHSCSEILHPRSIFSWPGQFWPDAGQFWPGQYFLYIFTKSNSFDSLFCVLLTLTLLEDKQEPFIDD